jgi:uncharacterized protein YecT (DUF1311 family)
VSDQVTLDALLGWKCLLDSRGRFRALVIPHGLMSVIACLQQLCLKLRINYMNRALITASFLLIASLGLCQPTENPCWKTAMAQSEMNRCADLDAREADADLNRVYQELLAKLKNDDNATNKLRAAQRAWLAFRAAHLQELYPADDKQREYGSMYPMCYAQVAAAMTKERTAQLRRMLDDKDPCDISASTVKEERAPQNPAEQWLFLSAEARSEYVHGYLFGFQRGKRSGCYLYEEKITPYLPHEAVLPEKLPAQVCLHSLPEFTQPYFQVYVDTITKYYKKYPHDRQAGVPNILDEMAVPPGLADIDQIHMKLDGGGGTAN